MRVEKHVKAFLFTSFQSKLSSHQTREATTMKNTTAVTEMLRDSLNQTEEKLTIIHAWMENYGTKDAHWGRVGTANHINAMLDEIVKALGTTEAE